MLSRRLQSVQTHDESIQREAFMFYGGQRSSDIDLVVQHSQSYSEITLACVYSNSVTTLVAFDSKIMMRQELSSGLWIVPG